MYFFVIINSNECESLNYVAPWHICQAAIYNPGRRSVKNLPDTQPLPEARILQVKECLNQLVRTRWNKAEWIGSRILIRTRSADNCVRFSVGEWFFGELNYIETKQKETLPKKKRTTVLDQQVWSDPCQLVWSNIRLFWFFI